MLTLRPHIFLGKTETPKLIIDANDQIRFLKQLQP